jgi:hypothetical protein
MTGGDMARYTGSIAARASDDGLETALGAIGAPLGLRIGLVDSARLSTPTAVSCAVTVRGITGPTPVSGRAGVDVEGATIGPMGTVDVGLGVSTMALGRTAGTGSGAMCCGAGLGGDNGTIVGGGVFAFPSVSTRIVCIDKSAAANNAPVSAIDIPTLGHSGPGLLRPNEYGRGALSVAGIVVSAEVVVKSS